MGKEKTLDGVQTTSVQVEKSVYKAAKIIAVKEDIKLWQYITEAVKEKNSKKSLK